MKSLKFLSLLLSAILFTGISVTANNLPEEGNGKVVKVEKTDIKPFTEVEVGGVFDVLISQGEKHMVIIETDENLVDLVTAKVKDDRLYLDAAGIEKATKLLITVVSPKYTSIVGHGASNYNTEGVINTESIYLLFSGASNAKLNIVASDKIEAEISGACDIELVGSAEKFEVEISGAAHLDAEELIATVTEIEASGVSNVTAFAVEKGDAEVSGVSDVKFVKSSTAIYNIEKIGHVGKDGVYTGKSPGVSVSTDDEAVSVNVGDIEVNTNEGGTRVRVGGREVVVDEDGNVDVKKIKKTRFDGHWGGLHLGVNGFLTADNKIGVPAEYDFMEPKYQRSFQFNMNLWEQNINLIRNKFGLITGVGFQWNNYFFDNNVFFRGDSSNVYGIRENIDGRSYEKSKLVVSYLTVPLLMEFQTNKYSRFDSFHITAGMVMGVQLRAHTKNVYNDNGKNKVKGWEDYNLSPFRWDAHAGIGWGKINLFASYALNSMFQEDKGPEAIPFTVGITLLGW